jgi:glycosyltransferase involved in cell wall biosynthesis
MRRPLVVIDADVLGRQRTGDETYVANLLRELPAAAPDLRLAAVTRQPELVPEGVEPVELRARSQEWRMASSLPRLLGRLRPALAHFQHSLPLRCPCPAILTVHDLSFERDPSVMGLADRLVFRTVVPRSARRAVLVIAVSQRTRTDLVELYGIPPDRIVVTPHGVDPIFQPAKAAANGRYLLFVGAVQERKNPLAALDAADAAGLPLVVVGPAKDAALADELAGRGASVRGWVAKEELADLYRGAAALLLPTRYEGFGLPVLEAMASGTPVVATPDAALREVAGDAAIYAEPGELADAIRRALERREELVAAGIERARGFSWQETAHRTAEAYRAALR